ncbi:MAG: helix-turn-helix domain-containing protein [Clostridia bacterium]|nr:helix-turn-helix domain-containing protein [Clostridia bacterium]
MAQTASYYKDLRKRMGMTREEVCDAAVALGQPLQPERLERIENGKYDIVPEEVLLLSEIYGDPTLCNHYCSRECPIGRKYVPEVKVKDLAQIVLEMISSMNAMKNKQERLIEITANGVIADDEIEDFVFIQKELERFSITVESLQLWVEKMLADKKINLDIYNAIKGE